MRPVIAALCLLSAACGGPAAPTPPPSPAPAGLPVLLAGQSNATQLTPYLIAAYAPGVTYATRDSTPLSWWDPAGPLWPAFAADAAPPLSALVWWQGEQDALDGVTADAYAAHLTDFFLRARAVHPQLWIVMVQIRQFQPDGAPAPYGPPIRAAQARVAAALPQVLMLSSDDLPSPEDHVSGSVHLTPDGYRVMAQRIIAAVQQAER